MTLRGIINKHKNAKQGLKYLERKLAKAQVEEVKGEDQEVIQDKKVAILQGRIEAKTKRVRFWGDARTKERVPKAA